MALSDDEDDDPDYVDQPPLGETKKRLPGGSKRAMKHKAGSKRVKQYEDPLPLNFQPVPGGWQKYTLCPLHYT
jgi:hypothetical protein